MDRYNLQVIDSQNINEKVYFQLKESILNSIYPMGHKLSLEILQSELGVSYTPIKDALTRLAGEGLVEIVPRKGTYIKRIMPEEIAEIIDTRMYIESSAVEELCKKITPEQLSNLDEHHRNTLIGKERLDTNSFVNYDIQFHLDLIKLLNNNTLYRYYKNLNDRMQIIRYHFFQMEIEDVMWVNRDHNDIITAIKERDPEKAKRAVKRHLRNSKEVFVRIRPN